MDIITASVKRAVQSVSHSCPKLRRLLVKEGMICPVRAAVNGREGRFRHAEAVEERDCPDAVWIVVMGAEVFVAEMGAVGMK